MVRGYQPSPRTQKIYLWLSNFYAMTPLQQNPAIAPKDVHTRCKEIFIEYHCSCSVLADQWRRRQHRRVAALVAGNPDNRASGNDLGYIDLEQKTLQTLGNPFGPRLLPMCPDRTMKRLARPSGLEPLTYRLEGGCSIRLS